MYKIDGNTIKLTRGDSFYTLVTMKRKDTGAEYTPQDGDVDTFINNADFNIVTEVI